MMRGWFWGLFCLICLAACIPATVPPQLAQTPGPAVVIAENLYDSGTFQVEYPAGWRVITSAADDPVSVIFAAPQGEALIMLGEALANALIPAVGEGDVRSERREIVLNEDLRIIAVLNATSENWQAHVTIFEHVIATLRPD